jgi:hypothetical protein
LSCSLASFSLPVSGGKNAGYEKDAFNFILRDKNKCVHKVIFP